MNKKNIGQIIAIGGGAFGSSNPNHYKISKYIINQSLKSSPNICFIPTATGEDASYIKNFNLAFHQLKCHSSVLSFFSRTPDLESLLLIQDIIYVGGGNTKSMLAVWKEWGLDKLLLQSYQKGAILCGVSAGAICWFEKGVTDSWESNLNVIDCLGFLSGACCPHYDGEKDRKPAVKDFVNRGTVDICYAIDDGAALHYKNGSIYKAINFGNSKAAYKVFNNNQKFIEKRIETITI